MRCEEDRSERCPGGTSVYKFAKHLLSGASGKFIELKEREQYLADEQGGAGVCGPR
jgi:hypothetical protein